MQVKPGSKEVRRKPIREILESHSLRSEHWRRMEKKNEQRVGTYIKGQMLRSLGHMERREKKRMPKMIMNRRSIGRKKKGIPRKR